MPIPNESAQVTSLIKCPCLRQYSPRKWDWLTSRIFLSFLFSLYSLIEVHFQIDTYIILYLAMFLQLCIWKFYSSEIVWGCQHETLNIVVIPFHSFVKLFRGPLQFSFILGDCKEPWILFAVLACQCTNRKQWMDWSWDLLLKSLLMWPTARLVEALSLMCSLLWGDEDVESGEIQPVGSLPVFHTEHC